MLEALKEKGYDPIQGPVDHVYSELAANMMYSIIGTDEDLQKALYNGDESAVDKILPVYERLAEIVGNGWTDADINSTYPADNYDQSILRFFEGDVPFWVCNTEKVGGMKKRESKSEAFTAAPFEYKFMFVPLGDSGVYEYREPWFGFSVNKDSDVYDYAVEFVRFLATSEQLNTLAEIKGVPAVTDNASDERYSAVASVDNAQISYTNGGAIKPHICSFFASTAKMLCMGEHSSAEEAARAFVQNCSTVSETD